MSKTTNKSAIKRIVNNCIKSHQTRPTLHGYWFEDGKQIVCDGYHALRLNDVLEVDGVNYTEQTVVNVSEQMDRLKCDKPLNLPTIQELKEYIKELPKGERYPRYDFGKDKPMVNPKYLLDMLEGLDKCVAMYDTMNGGIYFKGDNGDGLLLPIRKG